MFLYRGAFSMIGIANARYSWSYWVRRVALKNYKELEKRITKNNFLEVIEKGVSCYHKKKIPSIYLNKQLRRSSKCIPEKFIGFTRIYVGLLLHSMCQANLKFLISVGTSWIWANDGKYQKWWKCSKVD